MTTVELISTKLQELLGTKYAVKPFSLFSKEYIKPLQTPYGQTYDVNYQAFEEMKNIIPVCVNFQETSPINSGLFYRTGIMTIQFFVPIDALGRDDADFDFFGDYENLRTKLTNGKIALFTFKTDEEPLSGQQTVDKVYKAYFTLNEPTTDGAIHSTGAYRRMTYTVQGNATVLEDGLRTGDDYSVEIFNGEEYVPFSNLTSFVISRDEQGNAVQNEGTTAAMSPPVSRVHSISFIVSDKDGDAAVSILRKAVFKMPEEVIGAGITNAQRREVKIKLKDVDGDLAEFWALLNASYNVGGNTSVGSFSVTLTRTDDELQEAVII